MLRSIGASGKQVMRSVILEAASSVWSPPVVGLAAGIGVAAGLKALLALRSGSPGRWPRHHDSTVVRRWSSARS